MNKKLEGALAIIKVKCHPNSNPSPLVDGALEIVEQALLELKAIKDAKPSEAMECVDDINADLVALPKHCEEPDGIFDDYLEDISIKINTIKQALLKAQEQDFNYKNIVIPFFDELVKLLGINDTDEMLNKIKEQEKENAEYKKVLEIIKNKCVDIFDLKIAILHNSLEIYNRSIPSEYEGNKLTQEEFELLKRYFK